MALETLLTTCAHLNSGQSGSEVSVLLVSVTQLAPQPRDLRLQRARHGQARVQLGVQETFLGLKLNSIKTL